MTKTEALEKLQTLIENIGELQKLNYKGTNPLLDKFISRGERYLTYIFDKDNKYLSNFKSLNYFSLTLGFIDGFNDTHNKYNEDNEAYHKDLTRAQTIIESAIEEVEEWKDNIIENTAPIQTSQTSTITSNKVFIVHGHDNGAKQEVARFLEKLGLEPIILHEQASSQKTIIEKIESYADQVGFGVVLYTACDDGKAKSETELKNRARQNVVFEHGYLIGLLGRDRVCPLVKGDIETPGDISGVVYTPMDNNSSWHLPLARELKKASYEIDFNKLS